MIIRPFKALRPKQEFAHEVGALPYDVVTENEVRATIKDNPKSFLTVDRPEATLAPNISPYDPSVYAQGKKNLEALVKHYMERETQAAYYLYELTFLGRTQTGVACLVDVADYDHDTIKKHELTRPAKEQDRVDHMKALEAHTGPIFMTHKGNTRINNVISTFKKAQQPLFDFTSDDGIYHRLWRLDDPQIMVELEAGFEKLDAFYIADGHHRTASAVRVHHELKLPGTSSFLAVLFDKEELTILDYNRVIKDMGEMSKDEFFAQLKKTFKVNLADAAVKPKQAHVFGLYLEGQWFELTSRAEISEEVVASLPVEILSKQLLEPILQIEDQRTDARIDFVGGTRGTDELIRLVDSGEWTLAITVCPTTMDQLIAVSDAGALMPPKSTWFEPKLYSGLLIHEFSM